MLWLTKSTVRPPPTEISFIFPRQRFWNSASPTAEPHVHPRGVALHGGVEKLLDLGEGDDVVELGSDLAPLHPENGTVQEDVLTAAQLRMESRPDLEQRGHPAAQDGATLGRLGDARKNLEQGTLARAVAADDADDLSNLHVERDSAQGPEALHRIVGPAKLPEAADRRQQR
jgi:hypothetical protein